MGSRNHMKIYKSVIFVKKNLKMNISKTKNGHYTREYRGAAHSNLI